MRGRGRKSHPAHEDPVDGDAARARDRRRELEPVPDVGDGRRLEVVLVHAVVVDEDELGEPRVVEPPERRRRRGAGGREGARVAIRLRAHVSDPRGDPGRHERGEVDEVVVADEADGRSPHVDEREELLQRERGGPQGGANWGPQGGSQRGVLKGAPKGGS